MTVRPLVALKGRPLAVGGRLSLCRRPGGERAGPGARRDRPLHACGGGRHWTVRRDAWRVGGTALQVDYRGVEAHPVLAAACRPRLSLGSRAGLHHSVGGIVRFHGNVVDESAGSSRPSCVGGDCHIHGPSTGDRDHAPASRRTRRVCRPGRGDPICQARLGRQFRRELRSPRRAEHHDDVQLLRRRDVRRAVDRAPDIQHGVRHKRPEHHQRHLFRRAIKPADVYGGAGGAGNYAVAFGATPYTLPCRPAAARSTILASGCQR